MPCYNSSGVGKRSENVVVTLKLRFKFFELLDGGFHKRIIQISRCCHFIGGLARWGEIPLRPFDSRAAPAGRVAHKANGFTLPRIVFCHLVLRLVFFSGTPGPPPFSAMNSTRCSHAFYLTPGPASKRRATSSGLRTTGSERASPQRRKLQSEASATAFHTTKIHCDPSAFENLLRCAVPSLSCQSHA